MKHNGNNPRNSVKQHILRGLSAASAVLTVSSGFLFAADGKCKKPNILFIWTDQQNFGMLSCEGNKYIQTPNLDRLAESGVIFNNSLCTYPSSSPSRASVVTGAYTFNHRLYDNIRPENGIEGLKPMDGYKLADQYLYESGYRVAHKGKWHIGSKSDWGKCFTSDPEFSEAYSPLWNKLYKKQVAKDYPKEDQYPDGTGDYVIGKSPEPTRLTEAWKQAYQKPGWPDWGVVGLNLLAPEQTLEYPIIDQAIDFIEANKNQTWMATISISPPHDPWIVPEPYYSDIAVPLMTKMKIEGSSSAEEQSSSQSWKVGQLVGDRGVTDYMAIYHAQVVMMDDFIGRVLSKLDELNLTENTLIIFTSDHGDMLGMHHNVGKINNNLYNRLYHTPCIISYPAGIRGKRVLDNPVMHVDFMPTILDYAGIAIPEKIDGKSLRPLLENRPVQWRDYHLIEKYMNTKRDDNHVITNVNDFYYAMGVEDGKYKYIYTRFNNAQVNKKYAGPRFIDLQADPYEENNLFDKAEYRNLIMSYHEKLRNILAEHNFDYISEYAADPWATR